MIQSNLNPYSKDQLDEDDQEVISQLNIPPKNESIYDESLCGLIEEIEMKDIKTPQPRSKPSKLPYNSSISILNEMKKTNYI